MYRVTLGIENPALNLSLHTSLTQQGYLVFQESAACTEDTYPDIIVSTTTHSIGWQGLLARHRYCQPLVLVLTADQDEANLALEQGADDGVCAPYSLKEIAVRLAVRLRRRRTPASIVRYGSLVIDKARYYALVEDRPVDMTPQDMTLLLVLLEAEGALCSKQHLYQRVWDAPYLQGDRALDAAIARLKRKLAVGGTSIETIRSQGYCLRILQSEAA